MNDSFYPKQIDTLLRDGQVIPAHPLALDASRRLDERRQRALTRYYLDAGAGGIAVGVHTTQFEIRQAGLLEPVLSLAAEEIVRAGRPVIKVAGILGDTSDAVEEAELAAGLGYHLGLVGLGSFKDRSETEMVEHLRRVSEVIPVFGFYLQPSVGGRGLSYSFWRQAVEIEGLRAIKVAPFNRYATLDVLRAVWGARREDELCLYTGNDDTIVHDLLSSFCFEEGSERKIEFRGGLLGQWAVWTRRAVEILSDVKAARGGDEAVRASLLRLAPQLTDANGVLFDAANGFAGCIPGIHEVLRRQGLLEGLWTLDAQERLSPGQKEEIDRIYRSYPHLNDDSFIAANRDRWLQ